jgi:adenosylcobinamide-GDP ribazoletransferase
MTGEEGAGARREGRALQILCPFLAALQFLTIAPPLVRRPFTPVEMGRAVGYFPLVGVLLGGLLAGLDRGLEVILPAGVATALVLAAWVTLTGALHLDGFMDTCDGLLGGHSPEERLRILRDERVGAYAVSGGVLLLLVKYTALAAAPNRATAMVLAPTLGRWGMTLAVVAFPYARPEGLGRTMKDQAGRGQAVLAVGIALAASWFAGGWLGLAVMALAGVATWVGASFALGHLPGLTGDIYGAICEVVETLVLLSFAVGLRI